MTRRRSRWLVVTVAASVTVFAIDTLAWAKWKQILDLLAVNQEAAGIRLAADRLVSLPSLVDRTRRLAAHKLVGLDPEIMISVLSRLGAMQRRWMPAESSGFINLSRQEFLLGNPERSVDALGEALKRNPTSAFLHRLQALFLLSIGERVEALAEMAVAEAIAPGFRSPVVELSPLEEQQLRLAGLRIRPAFYPRQRTETALALARGLRGAGDFDQARSLMEHLRGQPEVEVELGRWAVEDGDFEGAIDVLLPVATRTGLPRRLRGDAWSMIAISRDLSGDPEGALAAVEAALEIDSSSPKPHVTLAGLAQGRGELDAALAHLRRAWGMDPTDIRLLVRIASVAEMAGKPADALLALERAVEIEPGSARIAGLLVELQLRTGHYAEAASTLSRALDRNPTDASLLRLAERLPREVGIR